ncbi:Transmembrane 9 superfamily member 11 [Vitis vinifera]|uniref:Transmembrane 9 superfamily member n=1 Tax=Vitis vinifera TaxID=29760 RepID=A0A438KGW7_VITVI|nr:Transmembrane 9 superfamily member 11 [Vitis vinifera]
MVVKEGEPIVFSYEVSFEDSDIEWLSRWDAYLKMEGSQIHWFSILNSLMVVAFLAAIVLVIFLRTIRRDLTQYEEIDKDAQAEISEEVSGWKLVAGDVFRPPPNADFLCILVGDGVQILGMAFVTVLFAAFGVISPASHGALLTGMLFSYLILGFAAGYSEHWRNTLLSLCHSPPPMVLCLGSSHFSWGYFGLKSSSIEYPVRINHIAREIPPPKYPSWLVVIGAGTLPFGTLFIELYFIMSSLWLGQVYYVFGFLLVVMILLVIVCAEVALVLTYMHLCVEDWRWWWQSFFSSGSVAMYILIYCVNYLVFDLRSLSGPVSATLYLGYSFLMVVAVLLATGSVGFLSSFWFVFFLFSSVKLD